MSSRNSCGVTRHSVASAIGITYSGGGVSPLRPLSHFQTCPCCTLLPGITRRIAAARATCPFTNSTALDKDSLLMIPEDYNPSSFHVKNFVCLTYENHDCKLPIMNYGERLSRAREYAKITQAELSARLGKDAEGKDLMSQSNISVLNCA